MTASVTTNSDEVGTPSTTTESAQDRHHRLRWVVLGVLALAQLMVVLDATIVNIALPLSLIHI